MKNNEKLNISDADKTMILANIKVDVEFLEEFKLMDYSLLLGIYYCKGPKTRYEILDIDDPEKRYSFSIIDYL